MNKNKEEMINKAIIEMIKNPEEYEKKSKDAIFFNIKRPLTINHIPIYFKCIECQKIYITMEEKNSLLLKEITLQHLEKNYWRTETIIEKEEIEVFLLEGIQIEQFCDYCTQTNITFINALLIIQNLLKNNMLGDISTENKKKIAEFFDCFCTQECFIYRLHNHIESEPVTCKSNCFPLIKEYKKEIKAK